MSFARRMAPRVAAICSLVGIVTVAPNLISSPSSQASGEPWPGFEYTDTTTHTGIHGLFSVYCRSQGKGDIAVATYAYSQYPFAAMNPDPFAGGYNSATGAFIGTIWVGANPTGHGTGNYNNNAPKTWVSIQSHVEGGIGDLGEAGGFMPGSTVGVPTNDSIYQVASIGANGDWYQGPIVWPAGAPQTPLPIGYWSKWGSIPGPEGFLVPGITAWFADGSQCSNDGNGLAVANGGIGTISSNFDHWIEQQVLSSQGGPLPPISPFDMEPDYSDMIHVP